MRRNSSPRYYRTRRRRESEWTPGLLPAQQKPRGKTRGFCGSVSECKSKLVIHAGAQNVGVKRHVVGRGRAAVAGCAAVETAEIEVKILDPGGPVGGKCGFKTAAQRPADIVAGVLRARRRRLDIAERGARCDIGHETVGRIADAAAYRRQPVIAGLAAGRAIAIAAAVEVGRIEVALDTDDRLSDLIVVAELRADQAAADIAAAGTVPGGAAEAAAAVDAEIESCPAIGRGRIDGSRRVVGRGRRLCHVGRLDRAYEHHQAGKGQTQTLHFATP